MSDIPVAASAALTEPAVLTLGEIRLADVVALLARYDLRLELIADGEPIPGSYWGDREAGLIGGTVHARRDTPLHSLLHEACHLIVLPPERRAAVHTDASDCQREEDATCCLQLLLADALPGFGIERAYADMDAWGYTFRLGSARAYAEQDADDVWAWLVERGLATADRKLAISEGNGPAQRPVPVPKLSNRNC